MTTPAQNREPTAIILAGHGSSHPRGQAALLAFAARAAKLHPHIPVRLAYTATWPGSTAHPMPELSLARVLLSLSDEGLKHLIVQSLHVVAGQEFFAAKAVLEKFAREHGIGLSLGGPLLAEEADVTRLGQAIITCLQPLAGPDMAVVLMGHGAAKAQDLYLSLAQDLARTRPGTFLGVIEAPGQSHPLHIQNIAARLRTLAVRQALVLPLLTVCGRHASRDLVGPGPKSWMSVLADQGITAQPDMAGLVEREAVAGVWLNNLARLF